ncbi:hypothetical protein BGZ83_005760 [Gryganskiella cystojenkinii]|nr:hypothetical protein BGZ83_005760 [Gryganskiella cystojenkinii]
MPSSPKSPKTNKHTLGLPARYPSSGRRCHSQRRILFLFSLVLLVSSGSLLILHITTSTFTLSSTSCSASSSSSSAAGECEPVPRRSRGPPNHNDDVAGGYYENPVDRQENYKNPFRTHDRPRAALPHPAENNVVDGQDQSGLKIPVVPITTPSSLEQQPGSTELTSGDQNQSSAALEQNEHSSSSSDTDGTTQDSSNDIVNGRVKTSDEDSDNNSQQQQQEQQKPIVPEQYPSFAESLGSDASTKYLTYLPYAGITNQFYGMLRGMEIARATGRTLIIPPIMASSHDKSKQNQPWSKFFDLGTFSRLANISVVEFHHLRSTEQTELQELKCGITCGFGSKRTIDFTAKGFLKQFKLSVTLENLPKDAGDRKTISAMLNTHPEEKYLCISNTYKILVEDKSEWERFGQHLHFTEELESFTKEFLDRQLIKPEPVMDPETKALVVPPHQYLAIHIRRGDFIDYCETNFKGPKMIHCMPTTEQIAERIDAVQRRLKAKMPLPVFVATNEQRPVELKKFADLGWLRLDHSTMGTAEALGVFGPMMVDQVIMAHAQALVGIQMSTFSRVGALRQRDWHQHPIQYM